MANGDIPAGWYPEPSGAGGERWWDGYQWTEHVRGATPAAQPMAQPQQTSQVPAGWYPDPSGGGGQRYWDGVQWTEHVDPPATTAGSASGSEAAVSDPATGGSVGGGDGAAVGGGDGGAQEASQVPAGWYPDPSGGGGQRYWDGVQWTEHVDPPATTAELDLGTAAYGDDAGAGSTGLPADEDDATGVTSIAAEDDVTGGSGFAQQDEGAEEPQASTTTASHPQIPAGWYSDPAGGTGQRWWDGAGWTDHVQDGSPGAGADAGTTDVAAPEEPTEEVGASETSAPADLVSTPREDLDRSDEDTFAGSDEPADEVADVAGDAGAPPREALPAEAAEPDRPSEPAEPEGLQGSDEPVETEPWDGSSTDAAEGGPVHQAGSDAPSGADAFGAAGTFGVPDLGEDEVRDEATRGDTGPARTPTDGVEADGEQGSEVDLGDAEQTQPLDTEAVSQSATEDEAATPATIPPGWYADPSGDGERWWSGDSWTEHVRPRPGTAGADPSSSGQEGFSAAGVGELPASGPPPDEDDDDRGGSSKLVLAIVVIVILLAATGAGLWFFTDVFDTAAASAVVVATDLEV